MSVEKAAERLQSVINGRIYIHKSLRDSNTFKVGGAAELLLIPSSAADIAEAVQICDSEGLPVTILGNGSNVLISDKGIRGLVIKLVKGIDHLQFGDQCIIAEAGVMLPGLAKEAARRGISGWEFGIGIPASIGGAIYMNAGAYQQSVSDSLIWVEYLAANGELIRERKENLQFAYRSSLFSHENGIIIRAAWRCEYDDNKEITKRMNEIQKKRMNSQPLQWPNAGCIFRNPENGRPAGWLLEQSGCKGLQIGDAVISEKHANFIINRGRATQEQICSLIDLARRKVYEQFGIELKTEIKFLGEASI